MVTVAGRRGWSERSEGEIEGPEDGCPGCQLSKATARLRFLTSVSPPAKGHPNSPSCSGMPLTALPPSLACVA